jgi:hypothetical protein
MKVLQLQHTVQAPLSWTIEVMWKMLAKKSEASKREEWILGFRDVKNWGSDIYRCENNSLIGLTGSADVRQDLRTCPEAPTPLSNICHSQLRTFRRINFRKLADFCAQIHFLKSRFKLVLCSKKPPVNRSVLSQPTCLTVTNGRFLFHLMNHGFIGTHGLGKAKGGHCITHRVHRQVLAVESYENYNHDHVTYDVMI